jgi:hypothetical protein
MDDFVKNIKDLKIKNIISSFHSSAKAFHNALGNYGFRLNPIGSCANPNPGSLFSPQGHAKGADSAISSISNSMNSLLLATNGTGSCYSNSSAWALSAPLFASTDPLVPNYYCADSVGNLEIMTSPITGPVCK